MAKRRTRYLPGKFGFAVLTLLWAIGPVFALEGSHSKVEIGTVWKTPKAHPGDRTALAVVFDIATIGKEHWHIYAGHGQPLPEGVKPSTIKVTEASRGLIVETAQFPVALPVDADYTDEIIYGYEDRMVAYVPVKISDQVEPGEYAITLSISVGACTKEICLLPETKAFPVALEVVAPDQDRGPENTDLFAGNRLEPFPPGFHDFGRRLLQSEMQKQ